MSKKYKKSNEWSNKGGNFMSRRGENIRKRKDGRWEARYKKGRKIDGSIQYGYVYSHKYSEAKKKQQEAIRILNEKHTEQLQKKKICFAQFCKEWMTSVRYSVKSSSYYFYETLINSHLLPFFGSLKLEQIDESAIQLFINKKVEEGYSVSYIKSMTTLLKTILKSARQKKYLELFPCKVQEPKSIQSMPKNFSLREWKTLEAYLLQQQDDFSLGLLLCMNTGIRIGELSGLKWGDFDQESGQIYIRRTVYRIKNESSGTNTPKTILNIGPPKTMSSVRDIPLPIFLEEMIMSKAKAPEVYILTGTERCMEPRTIQKKYKHILERCKIPYLNFHSLRHSFATIGIQKGFDYKSLSEILGHSSVNTTLSIYVHSDINRKRQCMELLHT